MSTKAFFGDWDERADMVRDFAPNRYGSLSGSKGTAVPDDADVLIAAYTYENYSGTAFVLFRQNGILYEVNGGHCSCYGLEGQWEPEEVVLAELRKRPHIFGYVTEDSPQAEQDIEAAIKAVVASLPDPEEVE